MLYNEGWLLLRLVLGAAARGIRCLPEAFEPRARWFSEACLYTPFAPRTRGATLAESHTHADGAIGHFEVGRNSRAGLHLTADATPFIVTEAKMFSGLSARTTRVPEYDHAARNVACLAWTRLKGLENSRHIRLTGRCRLLAASASSNGGPLGIRLKTVDGAIGSQNGSQPIVVPQWRGRKVLGLFGKLEPAIRVERTTC